MKTLSLKKGKHGGARTGAGRPKKKAVLTSLPLYLDKVSAGFGNLAADYIDQQLNLNEYFCGEPANSFCVRVMGESMLKAGIQDGDILIVEGSQKADYGKIVVAMIDNEVFVKRLKSRNGEDFLCSENSDYPDFSIKCNSAKILGIVKAVIHKF